MTPTSPRPPSRDGRGIATPGPLDHLPRPLDERDRGRHGRASRILAIGAIALVGAVLLAVVPSRLTSPVARVGAGGPTASGGPGSHAEAQVATLTGTPRPSSPVATAVPTSTLPTATPTPTPAPTPASLGSLEGYRWPLKRGRLTLPFGPTPWGSRIVDGERFHDGIDLATVCGDRVVAAHAGTVLAAGRHYDRYMGWLGDLTRYTARLDRKKLWSTLPIVVIVDDGNGYRSVYAHFGKVVVKRGTQIKAGQLLGYEGATGRASGCHLHYGLFSPLESARFEIDPGVVKRMKVPHYQIARVDPMDVLPARGEVSVATIPSATPGPTASVHEP